MGWQDRDLAGAAPAGCVGSDPVAAPQGEVARLVERIRELEQLKTHLFSSVNHGLRTPLALILGPAQRLLTDATPGTPEQQALEVVVRNARVLVRHVNDLLDLARFETERLTLHYVRTDVTRQVRLIGGQFSLLAQEQGIDLRLDLPGAAVIAQVDRTKLDRVLLNLLSNAFKLTPAGGRVRLALRADTERLHIEVADSGPGIPAELQLAMVDRLRPLMVKERDELLPLGLDLMTVHDFVALHDGRLALDTAPEGGARLVIELPMRAPAGTLVDEPADEDVADVAGCSRPAGAPELPEPPVPRILVIEPDPLLNQRICAALAGRYQVETVPDGHHGLALALAWYPDLIVLDRLLPTLGAEELVHALRARPGLDRTPILVVSAQADAAPGLLQPLAGVQDHLARSFQAEELLVRVGTQLTIQGAAQALQRSEEQWRELFEHASDGIFIADLTGRYTDINQAGCTLLGRTRDELIGRTIIDLIPPADVARLQQVRDRLIAGAHDIGEWRLLHKNGQHVSVEVSARIFSDGRWLGIVRDITARKLVADELEMRVRERTEQLRTLASELEAAENRERRQIARDLHDDLGQTLAAARIRLSPLCEDTRDDVRAAAQGIDTLIERANRATRSLAAQLAPAVLYELGLGPAIEWLVDEIRRTYGLDVLITDDGQPKPLSPEAGSILYRAVRELLINVARHAGTDRAEIEMLREGDHIVVRVSDSGVGFDTGQLDARTPHTGLGLLSVRERLSFIGGTAEVCSVPGDGTVAELSAPLVRAEPQAVPSWEVCI